MTSTRTAQQLVKHKGQFRQGPPTDAVVAQLAADFLRLREAICEWDAYLTEFIGCDPLNPAVKLPPCEVALVKIAREG